DGRDLQGLGTQLDAQGARLCPRDARVSSWNGIEEGAVPRLGRVLGVAQLDGKACEPAVEVALAAVGPDGDRVDLVVAGPGDVQDDLAGLRVTVSPRRRG